MTLLGIRRPGDGWYHSLRDRFYVVWLATLAFCLVTGLGWGDCIPLALGTILFLGLCPVGLGLVLLNLYRNIVSERWAYDPELGQVLRVAGWPTRRLMPVAHQDELTGVALAAEETATVRVADGPDPTAEQVVYLLRGARPALSVSRCRFSQRPAAMRRAQELAQQLDLPLRIGGEQERLLVGPNGEVSFALYDYSNNWARAAMGLAVFFTWPVMALGSLVLFSAVVLGFW